MAQSTSKIFMVKPVRFGFNPQTAGNNAFQKRGFENRAQENAEREFLAYTSLLKANGVTVTIAEDTETPFTPDSIFPNNWFSTHEDGTLVLYPMFAFNRRQERKEEFLTQISKNFKIQRTLDLSKWEEEDKFLEGTGSMILDRENKIVYACLSPRTHPEVLAEFCKELGYKAVVFNALDQNGQEIYHTNVMMCIGSEVAVICLDSITDTEEDKQNGTSAKERVMNSLKETSKKIIDISFDQMNQFAGNMLEVVNHEGKRIIVMSATARKSLKPEQTKEFNQAYYRILSPDLSTIEVNGGGSARCMMAELY